MRPLTTTPAATRAPRAEPAGPGWRGPAGLVGVCGALAGASLALPAAVSFDPWAWLVWGREVTRLALDTTGGPSWKPLPVAVTAVLAPTGSLAPALWLVLARTGGLLLAAGSFRLASRLAGGAGLGARLAGTAGFLAVVVLVLSPDGDPRLVRLVAEGHGAPLAAAAAVWAVDRHLAGRARQALLSGLALALLRPESWPFLALYAAWQWRRSPATRPLTVAATVAVPALWFGGDWWGAGDPLHGADAARVGAGPAATRLLDGLRTVALAVPAPAWVAAGAAVLLGWRRGDPTPGALAAGAVALCALVVGMALVLGYASLSRFLLPAVAVVAALAGTGAARALAALAARPPDVAARAAVTVAVLGALALTVPRAAGLVDVAGEVAERGRDQAGLPAALAAAGGRGALLACGEVTVEGASLLRPAVAWHLDLPLRRVGRAPVDGPSVAVVRAGSRTDRRLVARPHDVTLLARTPRWAVHGLRCSPS